MKAPPFAYHAPRSLQAATSLLDEHGDEAKILAGGQSLLPMLAFRLARPSHLVDISKVPELTGHWFDEDALVVRAAVTQRELERSADVAVGLPVLQEALHYVAHVQIRNRGTICGSVAHADPAAELPATMVALNATMVIESSSGRRLVPAEEFFEFYLTTVLRPDEVLTEVRVPLQPPRSGAAIMEVSRRKGDFALVGAVVVAHFNEDDRVDASKVVCFGVAPTPYRVGTAEEALAGTTLTDAAILEARGVTGKDMPAPGDTHATAAYRRRVAGVLVGRCLQRIRSEREEARVGQ